MSDWSRYSHALSQHNVAAGEDIRYLDRRQAPDLPDHDYWLFDSSNLFIMRFDEADRFIGAEPLDDPTMIVRHNYWRNAACHRAVRRDDFAAERPIRHLQYR
jgi:Family of unknown function (DUF6879)